MANIENKENTSRPINKTTETLIKELETMSDAGLHDLFMFFYNNYPKIFIMLKHLPLVMAQMSISSWIKLGVSIEYNMICAMFL